MIRTSGKRTDPESETEAFLLCRVRGGRKDLLAFDISALRLCQHMTPAQSYSVGLVMNRGLRLWRYFASRLYCTAVSLRSSSTEGCCGLYRSAESYAPTWCRPGAG